MKKRLLHSLFVIMGISIATGAAGAAGSKQAYAQTTIPVILDGKTLSFDVPPRMVSGRVLVPVRVIFESLGAKVTWDNATQTVYAVKGNTTLKIPIGSSTAYKNGTPVHLDVPSINVQGRSMVPIRFVSEAFGEQVSWTNQSVLIKTPTTSTPSNGTEPTTGQTSSQSSSGQTQSPNPPIQVIAGDQSVTKDQVSQVQAVLQGANIVAQLQKDLGRSFTAPVTIHVTKDLTGYRVALVQDGMSVADVNSISDGSNGVAIDSDIYIPLSQNQTDDQLRDILAHELTHVLLNETGVGDITPSWVNEGIAWKEGLQSEYANQPSIVYQGQIDFMRETILDAFGTNNWQGLIVNSEDTIHSTNAYNVEWQDYFAVDALQQTYGWNAVLNYLKALPTTRVDQAFLKSFGVTSSNFEATFNQSLATSKQKADQGMEVKLNVLSTFHGTIAVMPVNSNVWSAYTVPPGTYDVRVLPNGTIMGLPGIAHRESTNDPIDANTVFIGIQPDVTVNENGKTIDHSGLALATKYGQSYYLNSWTVDSTGQSQYDENPDHLGVQLLDVQPIH